MRLIRLNKDDYTAVITEEDGRRYLETDRDLLRMYLRDEVFTTKRQADNYPRRHPNSWITHHQASFQTAPHGAPRLC